MKNKGLNKISEYFLYFFCYSVFGWCYEVFLEVIVYRWGFSNRGVLFGPYCPVYGFGMLLFLFTIYRIVKNKSMTQKLKLSPLVFLGCGLIATIVELITSYLCEFFIGSWPWQTYVDYAINFEGRIALSPSIRFGLGGLVLLYFVQPLLEKLNVKMGNIRVMFSISIGAIMLIDFILTILGVI